MDRKKVFVCALFGALVVSFALAASAQGWDEAVDDTDAPYIDAEGNVDYEMAKEYAELVDGYIVDGVEWDVWLDQVGGLMWVEPKDGASTLDAVQVLFPNYVWVSRYNSTTCYYQDGSSGGVLYYDSEVSCHGADVCFRWYVCASGCSPNDATRIRGRAHSDYDYCDQYYLDYGSWYATPGADWDEAGGTCYGTGSGYAYLIDDDDGFNDTSDYAEGNRMVRWDIEKRGVLYSTRVYYWGVCIQ